MKKIFTILLLLGTLLLSACAAPSEAPTLTTGGELNPPIVTTEHPDIDPGHALPPFTDPCDTIEKYRKFVASHRLPEYFIPYEAFSGWGEFRFLNYHGDGLSNYEDKRLSYNYVVCDSAGKEIDVLIVHFPYANLDQYEYSRGSNEDMRRIEDKSEKWTYLSIGPVCYHYYGGNLIMLYIRMQEGEISLQVEGRLFHYDSKDTALSRLLTRSTAEAEAKALLAKIEA